jgi:hypothetical protein
MLSQQSIEMNVLVFSTTVESADEVHSLDPFLDMYAGRGRWNFALDDKDKILRIVSMHDRAQGAIQLLKEHGFECHELQD